MGSNQMLLLHRRDNLDDKSMPVGDSGLKQISVGEADKAMQAGEASAADFLVVSGLVVWPRAVVTKHLKKGVFERVSDPATSVSWDELFQLSHRPVSPDDLSLSLDLWKSTGKEGTADGSAPGTPEEAERVRLADQALAQYSKFFLSDP